MLPVGGKHLALPGWGLFPELRPEVGTRPAHWSPGSPRTQQNHQGPLGGPSPSSGNSEI